MSKLSLLIAVAAAFWAAEGSAVAANTPTTPAAARQAASADSPELAAFKKAIRAKYDMKEKAFANHDAETIVTRFYAPDVISVEGGPDGGIYVGREQIRPLYQRVVKDSLVKVDSVYTYVNGNAGWDWTDFHVEASVRASSIPSLRPLRKASPLCCEESWAARRRQVRYPGPGQPLT